VDRHLKFVAVNPGVEPTSLPDLPVSAGAQWYRPEIDPAALTALCSRRNLPAVVSTFLWLLATIGSGALVVATWGSWWLVLALLVHGTMACGAADARWHECGHGTAFTNDRLNNAIYSLASFLLLREPTVWRWSHARHHSETISVGRDPEIAFPRPPRAWVIALNLLHLHAGSMALRRLMRHSLGLIDETVASYVPQVEHRRVVREARVFVVLLVMITAGCIAVGSALPAVLIGLPAFYGAWVVVFFGATQHAGLAQNVWDHRLSTRSVKMNPFFRFLYLNMNHHLEHHLFPTVPYHQLPALQQALCAQLPAPLPSTWAAYRQIIPTLWTQRRDLTFELQPVLPTASSPIDDSSCTAPSWLVPRHLDQVTRSTLAVGTMCPVLTEGGEQLLCRVTEDDWVLTDALCTHGDAHLIDGVLQGWTLECPRHNGRFDLHDGRALRRPAIVDLAVTKVTPPQELPPI
jgi:Na+-transporting NADH:ubiquinone oxidoreductase subunit F